MVPGLCEFQTILQTQVLLKAFLEALLKALVACCLLQVLLLWRGGAACDPPHPLRLPSEATTCVAAPVSVFFCDVWGFFGRHKLKKTDMFFVSNPPDLTRVDPGDLKLSESQCEGVRKPPARPATASHENVCCPANLKSRKTDKSGYRN